MPQLDLEALFCVGGGDATVACQTALSDTEDPYAPSESLRLRIGEGFDWAELGAVLERDDSTKGSSNPKKSSSRLHRPGPNAASDRRRLSGLLKPPATTAIIGLPPCHLGRSTRRPASSRVFARDAAASPEPASPKVSCFGDVLPERPPEERSGCWASAKALLCLSNWCGSGVAGSESETVVQ